MAIKFIIALLGFALVLGSIICTFILEPTISKDMKSWATVAAVLGFYFLYSEIKEIRKKRFARFLFKSGRSGISG